MTWERDARAANDHIRSLGRWREVVDLDALGHEGISGDRKVLSFASNDYLGLTSHPDVIAASHRALDAWGAGSGAARLIVGSRPVHTALEAALAGWKGTEAALLFSSGFTANLGVLTALGAPDVLICSDELNHASIVDGCRAARARVAVYRHGDLDHLETLLQGAERAIVVTDLVFSMDGDVAPIDGLAEVCRAAGALLVIDEAHAVLGPEPDLQDVEHLRVGTLSKFLGSAGGFVAGPRALIDLLVNRSRPFIFTTGGSPADAAAALAALEIVRSSEGDDLRARLRHNIDILAPGHPSPIIPFVIGDERAAVNASRALLERGFLVPAIRPPSVPGGTSRLRVTVSAEHHPEQVEDLLRAIEEVRDG